MIGVQGIKWESPFGDIVDLFSTGQEGIRYKVLVDEQGIFSPTLYFGSFKLPHEGGEILNYARVGTRSVSLPVHVSGDNAAELRKAIEGLMQMLRPKVDVNGQPMSGRLVFEFANQTRFLNCVFAGGLEKATMRGERFAVFSLKLIAHDPFWYAEEIKRTEYVFDANFTPWLPWQFPWNTSVAGIHAKVTIGLTESWRVAPVFEVIGPAKEIVLENASVGSRFQVNFDLAEGEKMIINMHEKLIGLDDGQNLWAFSQGEMWELLPGENEILLRLSDATQESSVVLQYRERFFAV